MEFPGHSSELEVAGPAESRAAKWIAVVLGGFAALGGAVSFGGWLFDVSRLTDWDGNGISIQPNATVCVMLSGLAVLALAFRRMMFARTAGAAVGLIGGATLLQYISGLNFGIDELLMFGREWGRVGVVAPGRMGPPGSLCWTLIGPALVLAASPPGSKVRKLAIPAALATLTVSSISTISYVYGASVLYTMPRLTVIAFQTALFIMAVSVGILVLIPERQPVRLLLAENLTARLFRYSLPFLVLLPLFFGFIRLSAQNAGWFDTAFGSTIRTVAEIFLLTLLAWWLFHRLARSERAESESSGRAKAVLGSITDAFFTLDKDWRFSFVNDAALDRIKLPRDRLLGSNVWELFPDAVGNEAYVQLTRAMHDRVEADYEVYYEPWQRWFRDKAYPTDDGGLAVYSSDITERQHSEENLRRLSDERRRERDFLEQLIEASPVAVAVVEGMDLRFTTLNTAYRTIAGAKPAPEIGRTYSEVFPEAAELGVAEKLREVIRTGKPWKVRDLKTPIGTRAETWWEGECLPLENERGERDSVLILIWDITERKIAENVIAATAESLARERERLDVALRAGALGVYEWRPVEKSVWWSPETFAIFGVDAAFTPTVEGFDAIVHPEDRSELWRKSGESIDSREMFTHEYRIVRPDTGETRWLFNQSRVIVGDDGEVERITGIAADITERKWAEEALRESETRFRTLANAMPQIVYTSSADGVVEYLNEQWGSYTGVAGAGPDEIASVVHPDDLAGLTGKWREKSAAGESCSAEFRLRRAADGEYRWFLTRVVPVRDAEGNVVKWYGTSTDIHNQKLAQESLGRARDELEARVMERTAELETMHQEYVELLKRVAELQETERKRIGQDVHDQLGQSLTGLRLNLQSLQTMVPDGSGAAMIVRNLQEASAKLDADVSYLAWMLRPNVLDDLGLVAALASFVREWSRHHSINAEFEAFNVRDDLLSNEVETQLYRVVQEAMTNIAKHSGAVNVSVLLKQDSERLSLTIEDDGCGFDMLADAGRSRPGSGLGIRGMHERVSLVGGEMQIESSEQNGTTIIVRIRLSQSPVVSIEAQTESVTA